MMEVTDMKKYNEPKLDVFVIDIEDETNNDQFIYSYTGNHIIGGGMAEIIDDELVIERGYNNEDF